MTRHPVPDTDSYTLVDEDNANVGYISFTSFAPVNRFGYRGCGVFSCAPGEVRSNIEAIKRGGVRVFAKRTGKEL